MISFAEGNCLDQATSAPRFKPDTNTFTTNSQTCTPTENVSSKALKHFNNRPIHIAEQIFNILEDIFTFLILFCLFWY